MERSGEGSGMIPRAGKQLARAVLFVTGNWTLARKLPVISPIGSLPHTLIQLGPGHGGRPEAPQPSPE